MSDYCWGLRKLGHEVTVLCHDAPYLGHQGNGPNGESVERKLKLKGSFENGIHMLQDHRARKQVDEWNIRCVSNLMKANRWDGILVGNLDLLGPELLNRLLKEGLPTVHHVGFVSPPFPSNAVVARPNYCVVGASKAVQRCLASAGFSVGAEHVVYPGARIELLGEQFTKRMLPEPLGGVSVTMKKLGTSGRPLKVCFAGLMMASKGAHTLVEALIDLRQRGVVVQATLSGAVFQEGYQDQLKKAIDEVDRSMDVTFTGNLTRPQLARMYSLHHIGVFPSIYPEAFGITGAEIQASGLALVSSGIGGAAELIEKDCTGLQFKAGNGKDLAEKLLFLAQNPQLMARIAENGKQNVRKHFSVDSSSRKLERIFYNLNNSLRNQNLAVC